MIYAFRRLYPATAGTPSYVEPLDFRFRSFEKKRGLGSVHPRHEKSKVLTQFRGT